MKQLPKVLFIFLLSFFSFILVFIFVFTFVFKFVYKQELRGFLNIKTVSLFALNIFNKGSDIDIGNMRSWKYLGGDIKIEETLPDGSNYSRYIVSFVVDDKNLGKELKEYAYLTIPKKKAPQSGFPVVVFVHGYQVPRLYTPDGNYIPYMDALAREGFVVFKPDLRGNGKSDGVPGSSFFSPNYAIDVLSGISSIKRYSKIDANRIGIWGHSMGGQIALRVSEVSNDIKAVVIWNGVVGKYDDIINNWQENVSYKPDFEDLYLRYLGLSSLISKYGKPSQNPFFWRGVDPFYNLNFLSAPIQIHVGLSDNQVPPSFSKDLYTKLMDSNKKVYYYEYPNANHDINQSFNLAVKRTIDFYDKYLLNN